MGNYNCKECVEKEELHLSELCLDKNDDEENLDIEKSRSSGKYNSQFQPIYTRPGLNNYPQYAVPKENFSQNSNPQNQYIKIQENIKNLDNYDYTNKKETKNNEEIIQKINEINSQLINKNSVNLPQSLQKENVKNTSKNIPQNNDINNQQPLQKNTSISPKLDKNNLMEKKLLKTKEEDINSQNQLNQNEIPYQLPVQQLIGTEAIQQNEQELLKQNIKENQQSIQSGKFKYQIIETYEPESVDIKKVNTNENDENNNEEGEEKNEEENQNDEENNFVENNYEDQNIETKNINLRANIRPELGIKLFAEDKVESPDININKKVRNYTQTSEPLDSRRKNYLNDFQNDGNIIPIKKSINSDDDQINKINIKSNEPRDSKRAADKLSKNDAAFGLPYIKNVIQEKNIYYQTNIQNNNIVNNNIEQKKVYYPVDASSQNGPQQNYNSINSPNDYQFSQINQNNINNVNNKFPQDIHFKNYQINQNLDQGNNYMQQNNNINYNNLQQQYYYQEEQKNNDNYAQQNYQNYNEVDATNLNKKISEPVEIKNSEKIENSNSNLNDNKDIKTLMDNYQKGFTLGPYVNDVNNFDGPFSMRPKNANYFFGQQPFTKAQEISVNESNNNLYHQNESITDQYNTANNENYDDNNSDKESDYYHFKKNEELNK